MNELFLMLSLGLFTLLAGICSVVFNKLKLPPLIGYLVAGIILANIWEVSEEGDLIVDILSDMGLVLLMFCIGLEINLRKLKKQGMFAMIVCMVQMPLILIGGFAAGAFMGMDMVQSLALGAIMSGSSTAVVLAVLESQNYLDKDHNEMIILVLIVEDIGQVVLLSILGPMMTGADMSLDSLMIMILSIIAFMAASIFIGLRMMPPALNWLADNTSKEVVIVLAVGMAFTLAYLSMLVGLSMAIGAFLMGLIVASTRKSKDIHHAIEPMERLFMAMFFISVGMEVAIGSFVDNILLIIGLYLVFLVLKILSVYLGYFVANEKGKICWLSAVSLTVMGEFAFIIAKEALDNGVMGQDMYTAVVGAALISMIALPVIAKYAERGWDAMERRCPEAVASGLGRVVRYRDDIYESFLGASNRSKRAIRRSMAFAYVNMLLIIAVQLFFFLFAAPMAHWLDDWTPVINYDGWCLITMIANFLILFPLALQLVNNAKILDRAVVRSSRLMAKSAGSQKRYQKILEFNSGIVAFAIVTLIIAVVPNPLGLMQHVMLFILAGASIAFMAFLAYLKERNDEQEGGADEGAPEAEKPPEPVIDSIKHEVDQDDTGQQHRDVSGQGLFEVVKADDVDGGYEIFVQPGERNLRTYFIFLKRFFRWIGMDEFLLLINLTAFTTVAAVCSMVFNKIRLPPLIGYLSAGIILTTVWEVTEESEFIISILADMGLIMMMFCIGVEINLKKLRKQGMFAIMVGMVQIPMILIGGYIAGTLMGFGMVESLALGAIMSGSSTAVVLAVQRSTTILDRDHKEMLVLVLIVEDIAQVVLLSILSPMMAGSEMDADALIIMILSIMVFMGLSIFVGLRLIPPAINWLADNVSHEVVMVSVLGFTFTMALMSVYVGLSMAIGAFLAGMMVASTRKSQEIHRSIEPMESLFMAMFFISVGMEITAGDLVDNLGTSALLYFIFVVLMVTGVFIGYMVANEKGKTAFLSAVSLAVMGEFAFIISKSALEYGVITTSLYTSIVETALLSMVILPIAAKFAERFWDKSAEKCPEGIKRFCTRMLARRDSIYAKMSEATKKSRRAVRRTMALAYIDILAIIIIQIIFFLGVDPAAKWLAEETGSSELLWDMILMTINFLVQLVPAHMVVTNVKFLDEAVVRSSRYMSNGRRGRLDPSKIYQMFLELNSYVLAFVIVLLIITVVPNPLGIWEQTLMFAIAALILVLSFWFNIHNKKEAGDMDVYDMDDFASDGGSAPDKDGEKVEEAPAEKPAAHSVPVKVKEPNPEGEWDSEIEVFIPEGKREFRSPLAEAPPDVLGPIHDVVHVQGGHAAVVHDHIALAEHGPHVEAVGRVGDVRYDVLGHERPEVGGPAAEDHDVRVLAGLDGSEGVLHPDGLRAVDGGEVQELLCVAHGGIPSAGLLKEAQGLHLGEHVEGVVGGAPVGAERYVDAVGQELGDRGDPACGELHVGHGAGRDGHAGIAHEPDLALGEPRGVRGDAAGAEYPDLGEPLAWPHAGLLLVVVDLPSGLGEVEVHGGLDGIGELLGLDAGLLVADVDALEADSGHDLPLALVPCVEALAVLDGVAVLGGLILVQAAPAEDSADAGLLDCLGDDVLRVVEVHEGGGPAAHHLDAAQLGPDVEVVVGPVGVDPEHVVQEVRESHVVHDPLHHGHGDVRMGVDHPRHDYVAGGIDLPVGGPLVLGADGYDSLAVHDHIPADYPAGSVLGDDPCVADRCYHEGMIPVWGI